MGTISFADVVHQSVTFNNDLPSQALILKLIDTPWVQRLRDLSQTANTRLVYMFSEHSRFGHSVGVAYLAEKLMDILVAAGHGDSINPFREAVAAAALLHDVGHIAPGCHTAYKSWFPNHADVHERIGSEIVLNDPALGKILRQHSAKLPEVVAAILNESAVVPPWTWQLISGGGWNVDRGNWCIVDSVLAGVSYGQYNIPALIESIVLTADGNLALKENRLDAMMHFAVSRHAMYRQLYQHRVLLAADMLNRAIVQRARDLGKSLEFADPTMKTVLSAESPDALTPALVFQMTETWWRYHLQRWSLAKDSILSDLSQRLLYRRLLKTVRIEASDRPSLDDVRAAVTNAGFDPRYYLHEVSTFDMHVNDLEQSMPVQREDGRLERLVAADPLFKTLLSESMVQARRWYALPAEAKAILGRGR